MPLRNIANNGAVLKCLTCGRVRIPGSGDENEAVKPTAKAKKE
jgi:hypothetical protein